MKILTTEKRKKTVRFLTKSISNTSCVSSTIDDARQPIHKKSSGGWHTTRQLQSLDPKTLQIVEQVKKILSQTQEMKTPIVRSRRNINASPNTSQGRRNRSTSFHFNGSRLGALKTVVSP